MLPPRARFFPVLFLVLWLPLVAASAPPPAESATLLLRDALAAESRFDTAAALTLYLRAAAARPSDAFIQQKISRQYSDLATDASTPTEKQHLCSEALAHAQRAVALDPSNAAAVLSLAVSYGKLSLDADTRTRIEYSRFIRRYAEQALTLDPSSDYAHHVLGRWHYEVATLGAAKRFLARLIYDTLPDATTADAVRHLQQAVQLAPHRLAHQVELGFALLADEQPAAARRAFEHALALPVSEKHDADFRRRASTALAAL
jgi:tetratricopeptide (TPR) repeat protein